MIEVFVSLLVACAIFGICAAVEQATRPKPESEDWASDGVGPIR